MGDGKLVDLERSRLGNDLYQHTHRPQLAAVNPEDGLPQMVTTTTMQDSLAPPLEIDSFVCMGDESVFVVRDLFGDVALTFGRSRVRRSPDRFESDHLVDGETLTPGELDVLSDLAKQVEDRPWSPSRWLKVEPLRPQCVHYRRVMTDFENQSEIKHVERVCAAQRSEGGEFVSLADTRVYACEHRSPRDFVSEERLRRFDAKRLEEAKKTTDEWDPESALADLNNGESK